MLEIFTEELVTILTLALILVGTFAGAYVIRLFHEKVKTSDLYLRYEFVFLTLDDVVTDIVMRLAFAEADLSRYRLEAERTGRDIRLVAAMDWVNTFTTSHGIELDEELIVSTIESKLAQLKLNGNIPPTEPTTN